MPGRESVYKIDLDTEPRSKKTGTRRDRHIQNSKSRSAVADRLNSLSKCCVKPPSLDVGSVKKRNAVPVRKWPSEPST